MIPPAANSESDSAETETEASCRVNGLDLNIKRKRMDRAIPMAAKRTGDRSDEGVAERTKRRPATRRFIFAVSLRSLTSAISQRRRAGCIINKA